MTVLPDHTHEQFKRAFKDRFTAAILRPDQPLPSYKDMKMSDLLQPQSATSSPVDSSTRRTVRIIGGEVYADDLQPGESVVVFEDEDPWSYRVYIREHNGVSHYMGEVSGHLMGSQNRNEPIVLTNTLNPGATQDVLGIVGSKILTVAPPEGSVVTAVDACEQYTVETLRDMWAPADEASRLNNISSQLHLVNWSDRNSKNAGKFTHLQCKRTWCTWIESVMRLGWDYHAVHFAIFGQLTNNHQVIDAPLFPSKGIYHKVMLVEDDLASTEDHKVIHLLSLSKGYERWISPNKPYFPMRLSTVPGVGDREGFDKYSNLNEFEVLGTISDHEGLYVIREFLSDQLLMYAGFMPERERMVCPSRNHGEFRFKYSKLIGQTNTPDWYANLWTLLNHHQCIFCYTANTEFEKSMKDFVPAAPSARDL